MTFLQSTSVYLVTVIMFVSVIAFYLLGYRVRQEAVARKPERANTDLKAINGMLLGLLGLLLAFTFSMANARFDNRRSLIIEESNTIGTTILRTDLYPDSMRTLLRSGLRQYLEERIAYYEAGMDVKSILDHYAKGESIAQRIWTQAATYARTDSSPTRTMQFIPSLNAMIDVAASRKAAGEATIPDSIMDFLFLLCICAAFLLGYDQLGKIDWIVVIGFSIMLSATVFNIIDLDRPRTGLIDMNAANKKISDLRTLFNGN